VGTVGESLSGTGVDMLIEHWDGSRWKVVSPPPEAQSNEALTGVVAFDTDGWAVGWQDTYGTSDPVPRLFRSDGSSWTSVQPPWTTFPTAVGGSGPDDVWAVGPRTLQHFDGTSWHTVRLPNARAMLHGVTARAPDDVWVVGHVPDRGPGYDRTGHPYAAHFDGTGWTRLAVPHPSTDARLASVSASSSDDVWAVGHAEPAVHNPGGAFIRHFDGTQWRRVHPAVEDGSFGLTGVVAAGSSEVWAVGHRDGFTEEGFPVWRTLIERWNGRKWRVVSSESDTDNDNFLTSVAATPDSVWAVGGDGGALAERIRR
jgi:hypothetical protein